jgi:uncharacterized protein involved in exopolysaccharide biosynthesis
VTSKYTGVSSITVDSGEEYISLTDIAYVIVKNLKIIIITPLFTCFCAFIYIYIFAEPVYTSTAKIMSSSHSGGSQVTGLASQFGINLPTNQSDQKWVYLEILRSRTLAKAVLKQKFDTKRFGLEKSLLQIMTYGNKSPEISLGMLEIIGANKLLDIIDVTEDRKTGIFTIKVNTFEPNLAMEINSKYIQELDTHQRKYNKRKTSETKQFIQGRIVNTEKELNAAEESLKVFRDRNRRIENSPSLLLDQQRLGREVAVLTGVFTTLKQQFETTKIEEVKKSDYIVVVDPPELPLFRTKPNKKQIIFLTLIFSSALGIALAFINDSISKLTKENKKKINDIKKLFSKNIYQLIPKKTK